jgi:hypothetical protein
VPKKRLDIDLNQGQTGAIADLFIAPAAAVPRKYRASAEALKPARVYCSPSIFEQGK